MSIDDRLNELIRSGRPFTADDITDDGQIAVDSTHKPNGRQSRIGSLIRQAHAHGRIEKTGGFARSRAPHRKGGLILEWRGTTTGLLQLGDWS